MIALPQLSPGDEKSRIPITVEFFQNCLRPVLMPARGRLQASLVRQRAKQAESYFALIVCRRQRVRRRQARHRVRTTARAKRAPFDFRIDGVQRCRPQSLLQILLFKILKRTGSGVEQIARCVETSGRNFGANLLDVIGIFARRWFIIDWPGVVWPTARLAVCIFHIRATAGDGFLTQYFWADRQA